MDWQSNFMKENHFRWLVLGLMGFFVLFTIWAGVKELQTFQSVWDDSSPAEQQTSVYEIGNLTLTKTTIDTNHAIRYSTWSGAFDSAAGWLSASC